MQFRFTLGSLDYNTGIPHREEEVEDRVERPWEQDQGTGGRPRPVNVQERPESHHQLGVGGG